MTRRIGRIRARINFIPVECAVRVAVDSKREFANRYPRVCMSIVSLLHFRGHETLSFWRAQACWLACPRIEWKSTMAQNMAHGQVLLD